MNNNIFNALEIRRTCTKKLGIDFRARSSKSKEYNGWVVIDGKKAARITIPKGRKFIPSGTYASMARQLRIKIGEFDEFLECPLSGKKVKALIARRSSAR